MDLGLGAVSLTFQVFAGCMKGYQLLTEAKGMPEEHKYMRIQLKKEQYRLLDWGHVAGVAERDNTLVISSSDKGLLHDVLEQQQRLMLDFGKYDKRYKKLERLVDPLIKEVGDESDEAGRANFVGLLPPTRKDTNFQSRFPQQGELLLEKTLEWAKNSRTYPRRLQWAAFDKGKVEQLVLKLSSFNDFLSEMLNKQQMNRLVVRQERTNFQIIQLNNKIDQLVEIVQAGCAWSDLTKGHSWSGSETPLHLRAKALLEDRPMSVLSQFMNSEEPEGLYGQSLVQLAQFKAFETAISTQDLTDERVRVLQLGNTARELYNVELTADSISILDFEADDENRRVDACCDGKSVWVEWKAYEPRVLDGEPDPKVKERIIALVALLKENNRSRQFRAPRCLGYFRDIDTSTEEDRCRFGIVFQKPSHVVHGTRPISLLELLRATEMGRTEVPSLTQRVALAKVLTEAVERLHAVNWLHKGLRSENILFFNEEIDPEDLEIHTADLAREDPFSLDGLDFSTPYLSGFDYARPAQNEDLTEKPPENAAYDLYRHPSVQGSRGGADNAINFQKAFDIYALGVILLEIIFWRPIDCILDVDLRRARPSMTLKVRGRLIRERKFLAQVKANAGVMLAEAVRACLIGPEALVDGFGPEFDDKEAADAARLQMGFYEKVVEKLGEVKV